MVEDRKPNLRKESLSEVARSVPTTRYNARLSYRTRRTSNIGCGIFAVGAIGLMVLGGCGAYNAVNPEKDVTATVTDKLVKNDSKSSTYLIFTDKGVYQDSDSLIKGKFNSSDMYSELKVGKTYTFHIRGIRNHFLSWYPNIISVSPVK